MKLILPTSVCLDIPTKLYHEVCTLDQHAKIGATWACKNAKIQTKAKKFLQCLSPAARSDLRTQLARLATCKIALLLVPPSNFGTTSYDNLAQPIAAVYTHAGVYNEQADYLFYYNNEQVINLFYFMYQGSRL